jgi:hypothetical protein
MQSIQFLKPWAERGFDVSYYYAAVETARKNCTSTGKFWPHLESVFTFELINGVMWFRFSDLPAIEYQPSMAEWLNNLEDAL